jgi:hypothetical protein
MKHEYLLSQFLYFQFKNAFILNNDMVFISKFLIISGEI